MTGTLIWLIALGLLSVLAARVIRRMGHLAGATHELERFQAEVKSINARLDELIDPLVVQLDDVRRGACDPRDAHPAAEAALAELRALSRRARELHAPAALADRADQLRWEVDRAVRAADMAVHGLVQSGQRRSTTATEAQTALKRGTLGLRHARDAATRVMTGVVGLTPAEVRAMADGSGASTTGLLAPPPEDDVLAGVDEPPPG